MIKLLSLFFILTVFGFSQTTPQEGLSTNPVNIIYYQNARVIPSAASKQIFNSLIIRDKRIESIGNNLTVPKDARVIDLSGSTVYPGFIEPYIRFGLDEPKHEKRDPGPNPTIDRFGEIYWNAAVNAQRAAQDEFKYDKKLADELRALGFTTVQSSGLDGIFQGNAAVISLRDDVPNTLIVRENSAQFLSFSKGSSVQDYPSSLMGSIALIRQVFYDAQWYGKAWQAFNKNINQIRPEKNSALEALQPVIGKKQKVVFSAGSYLDVARAYEIASEFGLNAIYKSNGDSYKRLSDIKGMNAPLIVPVDFPDVPFVTMADFDADVNLEDLKDWDSAPENPARLNAAGITFAFTTDGLDKKENFLKNIRLAVKRGLDKDAALRALTEIPAELTGISDVCGTIAKGKLANLVIADKDIFDDDAEIRSVVVEGEIFEINKPQQTDVRGDWELSVLIPGNKLPLKMSVEGTKSKPSAKIKINTAGIEAKTFQISENKINFSLKGDSLNYAGILRFSGRIADDAASGHVILPDGQLIAWDALRKNTYTEKEEKEKEKPEITPALFTTVYPDKAYGRASLPGLPEYVAVTNATIWTAGNAGILENADILIHKGKIEKVGKNLSIPESSIKIDGTGLHVTPGIIDEHSHIAISRGVNEGTQAITAEVRIGDVLNPENINIYRQLSGGVTMSQLLHGSANPIGGQAQVIKLRWGQNAEGLKYKNAPPSIKFALGENVKQSNWGDNYDKRYPQTRMGVREIMWDGFQRAKEYGIEWQKYNDLSSSEKARKIPPRRDLELDALLEIINSERFIHCHSYVQSEILMLMRLAEEFGFKVGTFTHILEGYKVAKEMAEHGAMASTFADWWDYKFEVYEAIPYNTVLMAEQDVVTSVNSDDAEMARRLNHEAAKAIKYGGMSKEEAIKLVTINPAKQLKVDQYTGSLEAGKEADFVIWNEDPLSVYASPLQTWIEGRKYFDREEDKELRKQIAAQRAALIQKALNEPNSNGKKKKGSGKPGPKEMDDYHCDDVFDFMGREIN
ncbi:MAG: amidohydrolase family protein [Calditrichaeota bacterium]|nr:amidohydrolase family protein [Calditrichota bacterium]